MSDHYRPWRDGKRKQERPQHTRNRGYRQIKRALPRIASDIPDVEKELEIEPVPTYPDPDAARL